MAAADVDGRAPPQGGVTNALRRIELDAESAAIVATDASGACVGRATFERVYGPRAVVTLWVDEASRSWGLEEPLLAGVRLHAAQASISTLLLRVPVGDAGLRGLLRDRFAAKEVHVDGEHVDVELRCDAQADGNDASAAR